MKAKILMLIPVVLILLVVFSGNRANPPIERTIDWANPQTKALFYRACADCHSHETKWPWYSHVAPVSWFVIDHVDDGREHFNISTLDPGDADDAAKMVEKKKMPLESYLLLHPEADLSDEEKRQLIEGLRQMFNSGESHE